MAEKRPPARFHIDQYIFEHGAYHTFRRGEQLTEFFWTVPDIRVGGSPIIVHYLKLADQTAAFVRARILAQAALDRLTSQGQDHPKPAHLRRGKSRFERTFSVPELAQRWGVDPETVRRRIKAGVIPAHRTSRGGKRSGNLRVTFDAVLVYEEASGFAAVTPKRAPGSAHREPPTPRSRGSLIRASELARRAGVSRSKLYRMLPALKAQGLITPVRSGAREERFEISTVGVVRSAALAR